MSEQSQGPSTDRLNDPVIDPTKNVLDLVDAANRRQDDLRKSGSKHTREIIKLHQWYDEKLRAAETARINAIREVDVAAVQRAAEVAAAQASTLANQVSVSAETLRGQVAAAAQAATVALAAALEPVQKDIADLRRVQYEGVGSKTQVIESSSRSGNVGLWIGLGIAILTAGFSTLIGIAGLAFAIYSSTQP
jgi:hypothetical protein